MNSSPNTPIIKIIATIVIGFLLYMLILLPYVNQSFPNITPIVFLALLLFGLIKLVYNDRRHRERRAKDPVWYYRDNTTEVGPITLSDFQPLIKSRAVTNETMVWMIGNRKWTFAREALPELFRDLPPSIPTGNIENDTIAAPSTTRRFKTAHMVSATGVVIVIIWALMFYFQESHKFKMQKKISDVYRNHPNQWQKP